MTIAKFLFLLVLAAATAPFAISQTGDPSARPPQGPHQARQQHERRPFSLPGERIEARLAYLKTALKITDAQQPQWDASAETRRKQAREMDQRIEAWRAQRAKTPSDRRPSAIDRLERLQAYLVAASRRVGELLAVEKPLYEVLAPDQRQVADRLLASGADGRFHSRRMQRGA